MKKGNYLYLFIFSLLFVLPQICRADMGLSFLTSYPSLISLLIFMGVWIIEALTIKKGLMESPQKSLFIALFVNLVSVLFGFLVFSSVKTTLLDTLGEKFLFSFFATIIIELIILAKSYQKESLKKVLGIGILMNLKSYLFLFSFYFFSGMLSVESGIILGGIVMTYFLIKSFDLFIAGRNISSSSKKSFKLIAVISVIVICIFLIIKINNRPRPGSDAKIVAALAQLRSVAEYLNDGDYDDFKIADPNVNPLSVDIKENGGNLIINKDLESGSQAYCAYSKLNFNSKYYCIDSTGIAGLTTNNPGNNTKCPDDTSG